METKRTASPFFTFQVPSGELGPAPQFCEYPGKHSEVDFILEPKPLAAQGATLSRDVALSSKFPAGSKPHTMKKGDTVESAPATLAYRSVMEQYGYEVGKVIGNGSYGTVYEAYYTKQKVMVAVKIISKKKASEEYLNKFLPREIQV